MKVNIRKGDTVEVISGNHIGEQGEVQSVIRKKDKKGEYEPNKVYVVVPGVNLIQKASAPYRQCAHTGWHYRTRRPDPHFQCEVGFLAPKSHTRSAPHHGRWTRVRYSAKFDESID